MNTKTFFGLLLGGLAGWGFGQMSSSYIDDNPITTTVVCVLAVLALLWFYLRNEATYHRRIAVVHQIGDLCKEDIEHGLFDIARWRWLGFQQDVSYFGMVFRFWKPIASFYKDAAYLKPSQFHAPTPCEKNGCCCRPNSNKGE